MRVVLGVLLAVAVLAFVACGDDDEDTDGSTSSQTAAATATAGGTAPTAAPGGACGDKTTTDTGEAVVKSYDAEPPMTIDAAKTYIATVKTERGDFKIKLRPDLAPHHVNSFVFLAKDGYFDHVTFHRVLPGFVAQAGDPTGTGGGGPGYLLNDEFTTAVQYNRGTIGMARTNANNSAGSQWFVTYARASSLDGLYTIFGEVTEGMDVVDCIAPRDPGASANPPPGDKIITITIDES
jgi:cyclophilin family peptidyl-prolyl cis-trans isomerase